MSDQANVYAVLKECRVIGNVQSVFGWILTILFGMTLPLAFMMEAPALVIIMCVIFVLSLLLLIRGRSKLKRLKLYDTYGSRLYGEECGCAVARLAEGTGVSVSAVRRNIDWMTKKGFYPGAYLDSANDCIIVPAAENPSVSKIDNGDSAAEVIQALNEENIPQPPGVSETGRRRNENGGYKAVLCKTCGASYKIKAGAMVECEYCGSPLE